MRMVAVASWIEGGGDVGVQLPGFDLRPIIGAAISFPNSKLNYIRKGARGDAVGPGTAIYKPKVTGSIPDGVIENFSLT